MYSYVHIYKEKDSWVFFRFLFSLCNQRCDLYSNMLLSSTPFALMGVLYKSIVLTVLGSTTIEDICRKI